MSVITTGHPTTTDPDRTSADHLVDTGSPPTEDATTVTVRPFVGGDAPTSPRIGDARSGGDQRGQATAEYALVLLGAAAVALMLAAWAAKSGAISDLFDAIVGQLLDKAR